MLWRTADNEQGAHHRGLPDLFAFLAAHLFKSECSSEGRQRSLDAVRTRETFKGPLLTQHKGLHAPTAMGEKSFQSICAQRDINLPDIIEKLYNKPVGCGGEGPGRAVGVGGCRLYCKHVKSDKNK